MRINLYPIGLHSKDRLLLERIKNHFDGAGVISEQGSDTIHSTVNRIEDIAKIIEHFDRYPLLTQKHVDDINVLHFIQQTLQIGKVTFYRNMAYFRVGRREEIKIIIDIFSNAPHNTTKQLNFLDFKKAFELYTGTEKKKVSLFLLFSRLALPEGRADD